MLSNSRGDKRPNRRSFLKAAVLAATLAALPASARRALGYTPPKEYNLGEIGGKNLYETVEVRGVCTYCSVGCGIIFYRQSGGNHEDYKKCVREFLEKYGEWYAITGPDGKVWAYSINFLHRAARADARTVQGCSSYL